MFDQVAPETLGCYGNRAVEDAHHRPPGRARRGLRRGVLQQPAVHPSALLHDDRSAAVGYAWLRQRGLPREHHPDLRPLPAHRRLPHRARRQDALRAARTSCTGSRSGAPPTSTRPTSAGRPTGCSPTSGSTGGTTTWTRSPRPASPRSPTSCSSTTRSVTRACARCTSWPVTRTSDRGCWSSPSPTRTTPTSPVASTGTPTKASTSRCPGSARRTCRSTRTPRGCVTSARWTRSRSPSATSAGRDAPTTAT